MISYGNCMKCKYYHVYPKRKNGIPVPSCDAFPDMIPPEIFSDEVIHDKSYPGDHGIQYEPANPDGE